MAPCSLEVIVCAALFARCVLCSLQYDTALADADPPLASPQSLTTLCNTTTYPSLCLSTLSSYPSSQPSALLQDLTAYVVSAALIDVNRSYSLAEGLAHVVNVASDNSSTLQDCLELMDDSRDGLQRSIERLSHLDGGAPPATLSGQVMDVRVWLSASLTDLDTCWEELADPSAAQLRDRLQQAGQQDLEPLLAIALALAETLQQPGGASTSYALPHRRRPCPGPAAAPIQ